MMNFVFVFLGGGFGSIIRYLISEFVRARFKTAFPLATLCSNMASCMILAVVFGFFNSRYGDDPTMRTFLVVGFCGGFSTFSTFSYETVELFRSGNVLISFANILISVTVCFALIYFFTK